MRRSVLKNMGTRPDGIIVDLRRVLTEFSPNAAQLHWVYQNDRVLQRFVQRLGLHRIVEAGFIVPYDVIYQERMIWNMIEALFPEGTGEFEDSQTSLECFEYLNELMISVVDSTLLEASQSFGFKDDYSDLLFERWLGNTDAIFLRRTLY